MFQPWKRSAALGGDRPADNRREPRVSILFGATAGTCLGLQLVPAVLALTDIFTLTAYLALASWLLQ
jgi:hypothetical protein